MRGICASVLDGTRYVRHKKNILIETGHTETAQERHEIDVDASIMTTYRWVL